MDWKGWRSALIVNCVVVANNIKQLVWTYFIVKPHLVPQHMIIHKNTENTKKGLGNVQRWSCTTTIFSLLNTDSKGYEKKNLYVLQGLYIALSKRQLSLYIYLHATVDENKAISEQIQRADCTGRLNTEKRYRNVGQHTEMVLELKEKKGEFLEFGPSKCTQLPRQIKVTH